MKKNYYHNLTDIEYDVFKYIQKNQYLSIRSVASDCHVSTATVSRVAVKLGYEGYDELKKFLQEEKSSFPYDNLINKEVLLDFFNLDGMNELKVFFANKKILVYGIGASYITAMYFARRLIRNGYDSQLLMDEEMLVKADVLVLFSSSGEGDRIIKVAQEYLPTTKVVAVTKNNSTLDTISSVAITHNITIDTFDTENREIQLHLIIMADLIIQNL